MLKNKTRSKAYACFMSVVTELWKIFLEWYETLTAANRIINRENLVWFYRKRPLFKIN